MTQETMTDNSPLRIGLVGAADCDAALRLVFSRMAMDCAELQTFMSEVLAGENVLVGAYRGPHLRGAVFLQLQPGKTAALWPPQLVDDEPPATAMQLLRAVGEPLAGRGIQVVQALLETGARTEATVLRKGGYQHVADLLYLVAANTLFPVSPPRGDLEFEPYSTASRHRLLGIVDATYQQTLDCPQLNGVRDAEDVLTGYQATGVFDPHRWLIVRHDGDDVGCLLVADHPRQDTCELVYMGVAPAWRGRGWGMDIAQHAQWLARQAGRQRLVLAVDAANEPAIRMYAAVGFQAWDRRAAYLMVLSKGRPKAEARHA
jgi:mycothiol synthase